MFEDQNVNSEIFQQRVLQFRDEIDHNLSQMQQYMQGLSQHDTPQFQQDYDEIVKRYHDYLSESNIAIDTGASEEIFTSLLENFQLVLDYTQRAIDNINGVAPGGFDDVVDGTEETRMVAPGPQHNGQTIDMQNVSPIKAWWLNLNPAAKMLIKAAALGAVVMGGKFAYDKVKSKVKEDALKEIESDVDKEEEEEVEKNPLANFKWD